MQDLVVVIFRQIYFVKSPLLCSGLFKVLIYPYGLCKQLLFYLLLFHICIVWAKIGVSTVILLIGLRCYFQLCVLFLWFIMFELCYFTSYSLIWSKSSFSTWCYVYYYYMGTCFDLMLCVGFLSRFTEKLSELRCVTAVIPLPIV